MLPPAIIGGALSLLLASQMAAAALHQNQNHHHHSHQLSNNNSSNKILGHHFPPAAPPHHPNPNSIIFGKYSAEHFSTPIPADFQEQIATSKQSPAAPAPINVEHPFILFARSIYSWLVPSMVAILLTAVLGNGLIVLSAMRLSSEASHYNWLCISLAGADAWAATLLIAGLILNSYLPVVLKIVWWQGKCVAALLEIFRIAGMLTSNLHILALAANQFIGICYPLLYKTTISTERVRVLILFLWLIPIGFVGTWFVSIPGDSLFSEGCPHQFYTRLPFRLYIFVAFASILFLTFIIYAHILVYLLRQKARYRLRRNSVLYSYRRRVQSKMKLLTTTLLILSTFTLSWGVCVLYFVLVCKNGCPFIYLESISFQNGLILNSSVNFLVALKLVLNPLIYALRIAHIRKSVADMFGSTILRSRSLSSFQLFTLRHSRPMSRQLSSPRPFVNRPGDDPIPSPTISDPPSRGGMMGEIDHHPQCDGSSSSRELLRREKCSGQIGKKKILMRNKKGSKRVGAKIEERKGNKLVELLAICINNDNNSMDDDGRASSALALTIPLEGRGSRMEF